MHFTRALVLLAFVACGPAPDAAGDGPDVIGQDRASLATNTLPATCFRSGEALIAATVRVTRYGGLQHGHNGTHEIVEATLDTITYDSAPQVIDSQAVSLAMNVSSSVDPSGLPQEIPLKPGDTFDLQGIYIPQKMSGGSSAVIHFTHDPCGYVRINGNQYH